MILVFHVTKQRHSSSGGGKKQTANCNYFDGLMYISKKYSKKFKQIEW